jgi:hypothetical protein
VVITIAVAFAVGIGVKEIFDSRSAGAVAWILVLASVAVFTLLRSPKHPELITPVMISIGAGWIASSGIVIAAGLPALAPLFLLIGAGAMLYAGVRSRAR